MQDFDYIILGAGINGCAIARELAGKNRKVLVLDKSAIGSGTSSKSSMLIHGGLRYLENLEFSLVKRALKDRDQLLSLFPDLVRMVPFYLPVYEDSIRSTLTIWLGLKIYDFLGRGQRFASVPIEEFKDAFPEIKTDKLRKVYRYLDARTDDLELTRRIARDARSNGAEFIEHVKINEIEVGDRFCVLTEKGAFVTRNLVNVTGPWIDEVNCRFHLPSNYKTTKVSGIHLEIKDKIVPCTMILEAQDKRVFFLIPKETTTIVGTTERLEIGECDKVVISEEDVKYLLVNINKFLKKPLNSSEIMNKWIGIRPLIKSRSDLSKISREYLFDLHTISGSRLMNVYGGKLTTCLSLSREAVELLEDSNDKVFR